MMKVKCERCKLYANNCYGDDETKCLKKNSKTPKQIVLFFETIFPNLDLTIEKCSRSLLSKVALDIEEKVKALMLIPLYLGLELIFCQINDSEKSSVPLIYGKQNTKTVSDGIRSF